MGTVCQGCQPHPGKWSLGMNALPAQLDINSWLELATKGLPDDARQRVCEEIEDHYWNSARYFAEQGKLAAEAHRDAIAELCDAQEAHCAFRDAHASKIRYLVTGLLSMAMPLIFAAVFLEEPEYLVSGDSFRAVLIGIVYLLQPLLLALPMLVIVCSGYSLLSYRFRFPVGIWRAGLLIAGLLVIFLPASIDGVSLIVIGTAFFTESGMTGVVPLRGIISDAGVLLLSLGLIATSHHISRLKHSLYGMKFMLMASSWVWGLSQLGLLLVGIENSISPLVFVLMFTATGFCIFLGWMFIKAAFMGRLLLIPTIGKPNTST
jgi:hypothetical protein